MSNPSAKVEEKPTTPFVFPAMNATLRTYFLQQNGFTHDPFETPVAEQELERLWQIFYSYYTPFSGPINLLQELRQSTHAFVFGAPGQGKSTLRLTLEAECRTVLDGTLAVTYPMGEDILAPLSIEQHGSRLTRALARDLLVSVLEQFNPLNPAPNAKQIEALKSLLVLGGRSLARWLDILTSTLCEADALWGLSRYWPHVGKAPVRYVENSPALQALLENLKPGPKDWSETLSSWETFWHGLEVAYEWGFKRVLVLVDGVDSRERTQETMLALLEPLLQQLSIAEEKRLFFKFFLPTELKETFELRCRDLYPHPIFSIMLMWDIDSLRHLLVQRLRAAAPSRRYASLDNLAENGLALEQKVLQAAAGSPRRLLKIVSTLIDVHLLHQPQVPLFTCQDWERTLNILQEDLP